MADRPDGLVRIHPTTVQAPRQAPELGAGGTAERRHQGRLGNRPELADRLDPQALQALQGAWAHAPYGHDRQRIQELPCSVGRHHQHTAPGHRGSRSDGRLRLGTGQLGQELVGRYPDAAPQALLLLDVASDGVGHPGGRPVQPAGSGHVQEGLVQGQRFDQRRVATEYRHHTAAHLAVVAVVPRQEHEVRAEATCPRGRHRRVDAVDPGLVGGRCDHGARTLTADHDRKAT